jgi:hypothetical protein
MKKQTYFPFYNHFKESMRKGIITCFRLNFVIFLKGLQLHTFEFQ